MRSERLCSFAMDLVVTCDVSLDYSRRSQNLELVQIDSDPELVSLPIGSVGHVLVGVLSRPFHWLTIKAS